MRLRMTSFPRHQKSELTHQARPRIPRSYVGWCCFWINLRRPHPSRPEHGCALETQAHHCGLLRSILDVGSIKVDLITRKAALVVCCACPGHLGMARSREASLSPGNFGAHHAEIDRSVAMSKHKNFLRVIIHIESYQDILGRWL
jgi:hypothetical protein